MSVSLSAAAAASNETPPGAAGLVAGVMAVQVTTTLSSRARFSLVEITMRQSGVTFVRVASNSRNRALAAEISTGSAAETAVTVPVMAPFAPSTAPRTALTRIFPASAPEPSYFSL